MKVDFKKKLKALDGRPLVDEGVPEIDETGNPKKNAEGDILLKHSFVTAKSISINALMSFGPQDKTSGKEKLERYQLGVKINNGDDEFTVEEIALVKKLVGEFFGPLIVGQVWEMLEDGSPKDKGKK